MFQQGWEDAGGISMDRQAAGRPSGSRAAQERLPATWMGLKQKGTSDLHSKVSTYDPSGSISLIDYDGQKYSYRCVSIPMGPLSLDSYNLNKDFIQGLPQEIRKINLDHFVRKIPSLSDNKVVIIV